MHHQLCFPIFKTNFSDSPRISAASLPFPPPVPFKRAKQTNLSSNSSDLQKHPTFKAQQSFNRSWSYLSPFSKSHQLSPLRFTKKSSHFYPPNPTKKPMSTLKSIFLPLLLASISLALASDPPSAYEMLEQFNFPKGILPQGVKRYSLNQDGTFEVELSGDCGFKVEGGYLLRYKKRLTGVVESGVLRELRGVSVKVLLVWFGIGEVVRSDATLYFYVGPLSASFPASNFEECPQCRCGFGFGYGCANGALDGDDADS